MFELQLCQWLLAGMGAGPKSRRQKEQVHARLFGCPDFSGTMNRRAV